MVGNNVFFYEELNKTFMDWLYTYQQYVFICEILLGYILFMSLCMYQADYKYPFKSVF